MANKAKYKRPSRPKKTVVPESQDEITAVVAQIESSHCVPEFNSLPKETRPKKEDNLIVHSALPITTERNKQRRNSFVKSSLAKPNSMDETLRDSITQQILDRISVLEAGLGPKKVKSSSNRRHGKDKISSTSGTRSKPSDVKEKSYREKRLQYPIDPPKSVDSRIDGAAEDRPRDQDEEGTKFRIWPPLSYLQEQHIKYISERYSQIALDDEILDEEGSSVRRSSSTISAHDSLRSSGKTHSVAHRAKNPPEKKVASPSLSGKDQSLGKEAFISSHKDDELRFQDSKRVNSLNLKKDIGELGNSSGVFGQHADMKKNQPALTTEDANNQSCILAQKQVIKPNFVIEKEEKVSLLVKEQKPQIDTRNSDSDSQSENEVYVPPTTIKGLFDRQIADIRSRYRFNREFCEKAEEWTDKQIKKICKKLEANLKMLQNFNKNPYKMPLWVFDETRALEIETGDLPPVMLDYMEQIIESFKSFFDDLGFEDYEVDNFIFDNGISFSIRLYFKNQDKGDGVKWFDLDKIPKYKKGDMQSKFHFLGLEP